MSQLDVQQLNLAMFSHSGHTLVAERSDFGRSPQLDQPLYDDAVDVGFAIRNPETRNVTRWYLAEVKHDGDDGITAWVYRATPETLNTVPALAGWETVLFND